jgi:uncharacterized protein (TIGR02246 family)
MQPTGRTARSSVGAQRASSTLRNVSWCGRDHDRPRLMRISLGGLHDICAAVKLMNPQTEARVGEVEQVVGRLEAAFNARDPVAMAALYTEDAVLMPPNDLPVHGSKAIQAWFDQALPRLGAIRLAPTATRVGEALAVQVGTFKVTPSAPVPDSPAGERAGKYVLVLTRVGRQWAIWADLWNLDQPLG